MTLTVTSVRFRPAPSFDRRDGLLGFAAVTINHTLAVESVAVRRTRAGKNVISLPTRRDGKGVQHAIVAVTTHEAHQALESQVLAELRVQGVLP